MKFGFALGDLPAKDMVRVAEAAERFGFSTIWVADHTPATRWRDPFVSMAAIGQGTSTIRIGCGVANPYSRYPANVGIAAATLVELCGDRIILGMGPGGTLPLRPLEIKMWEQPVTAVKESIEMLRCLFKGDLVDYEGKVVRLKGVQLFSPVSIPLYIGTRGPVLSELAGAIADGIILTPPFKALPLYIDKVKEGLKSSGRNKIEIVDNVPVHISENSNIDPVKPAVALCIPTTPPFALKMAGIEEICSRITEVMKTDRSKGAELVSEGLIADFAIAGNARQCINQIEAIKNAVDELNCLNFGTFHTVLETVKKLGKDVIPSFS